MIEAGGSDNHLYIRMPAGVAKITAQKSWPYETEPEPHANNRKVLGGSSSVNGMIYIRGQKQDYDNWAQEHGCENWSYEDVLPWFKKAEQNESLSDSYHGTSGPLPVSENRYRHPLSMVFVRAAQELRHSKSLFAIFVRRFITLWAGVEWGKKQQHRSLIYAYAFMAS